MDVLEKETRLAGTVGAQVLVNFAYTEVIQLTICHVGLLPSVSGNGVVGTLAIQRRQSASRIVIR